LSRVPRILHPDSQILHRGPIKRHRSATVQSYLWTVGFLCALLPMCPLHAQGLDPKLTAEVAAIRAELARNTLALHRYTWTERTQVLANGEVQSSNDAGCRYDADGQVLKESLGTAIEQDKANGISKRPMVRKKADLQDYIQRTIGMMSYYVPPKPEQLDAMLARGDASLEHSEPGKSRIRFKDYYQRGDSMTFTYDPASKALLSLTVLSTLGNPKDPVTLEAVFETLPDGVNHLAATTVIAKKKKIEVKTRNVSYAKAN
jgi:hypothetical protein